MPKQRDTGFTVQAVSSEGKYIRLQDELVAKMEWIAVKNGIRFNELINQCCRYALKHMENEQAGDS